MLIWIFQTGEPLQCDKDASRPMRAINLSDTLIKKGHRVKIISSRFYHQKKRHRNYPDQVKISDNLEIQLINSPGYNSHKGFSRLYDHYILSIKLKSYLKKSKEKPDLIFVGYPPIRSAYIFSRWAIKNKIPYLIDIKDKWPDIFVERLPIILKKIGKIILFVLFKNQSFILKNSTGIVTNSEGFLKWSTDKINRSRRTTDLVAPLSSPFKTFTIIENNESENLIENLKLRNNKNELLILYSGVISEAFDYEVILRSMEDLIDKKLDYKYIIAGDGPKKADFENKAKKFKDNIFFCGWVNGVQLHKLLEMADVGIAAYKFKDNYSLSLTNKTIDYLKYGLPIILPELGDVSSYLLQNNVCLIYDNKNSLSEHIISLKTNNSIIKEMSINSKNLYESEFNFETVYSKLVMHIENVVNDFKNK